MMRSMSSSSASSLLRLFVITVVVVGAAFILVREIIIPAFVNYQHGLLGSSDFTIRNSQIQGLGLYTLQRRAKGDKLFIAINPDDIVTPIGSKINHCLGSADASKFILPNTYLSWPPNKTRGEWWIIASRDIAAGEELTVDYTNTPDFIDKPDPNWKCPL